MQTLFSREQEVTIAKPQAKKPDKYLGVRIVLLLATIVSAFTMPALLTFVLLLAWIVMLVLPN